MRIVIPEGAEFVQKPEHLDPLRRLGRARRLSRPPARPGRLHRARQGRRRGGPRLHAHGRGGARPLPAPEVRRVPRDRLRELHRHRGRHPPRDRREQHARLRGDVRRRALPRNDPRAHPPHRHLLRVAQGGPLGARPVPGHRAPGQDARPGRPRPDRPGDGPARRGHRHEARRLDPARDAGSREARPGPRPAGGGLQPLRRGLDPPLAPAGDGAPRVARPPLADEAGRLLREHGAREDRGQRGAGRPPPRRADRRRGVRRLRRGAGAARARTSSATCRTR